MKKLISLFQGCYRIHYLLPLMLLFLFAGCEKDVIIDERSASDPEVLNLKASSEKVNDFYGPARPFAKGVVRAVVTMNHNGEPESIGIKFSERILDNLPDHLEEFSVELPNKAKGLPFDHIDLGWNPEGHEPPGTYDLPHFDIHFYMISQEEKMQIADAAKAELLPGDEFIPESYSSTPGFVPMMGKHWVDILSDEFHGGIFSQTFIFGSYDEEVIFYEPMVTKDYLLEKTSKQYEIRQPAEFQRTGLYYPTTYSISYDATRKEYTISMENMVLR